MMRAVNAIERLVLLLLAVPVLVIILDVVLRFFNARIENPVVSTVRNLQMAVTPNALQSMFPNQVYYQTALLTLAMYGIVMLLVVLLFRLIKRTGGRRGAARS